MNITDQLQEIGVSIAKNRLVAALKKMTDGPVTAVGSWNWGQACIRELFFDQFGNFCFCSGVLICFIVGAEPADHGGIAVEPTSDLNGLQSAPLARIGQLRPRFSGGLGSGLS
jgi:hypothetical protein